MTHRPSFAHTLVLGAVFATMVFFAPIFFAATFVSKFIVSLVLTLALAVGISIYAIKHNHWQLSFSKGSVALLGLMGATALSALLTQPYPAGNLFGLGGFLLLSLCAAWLVTQVLTPEAETADSHGQLVSWSTLLQHQFLVTLGVGVVVLAITTLLQQFGVGPSQWINKLLGLNLPTDLRVSLAGSPLVAAQFGLLAVVAWSVLSWHQRRVSPLSIVFILSGLLTLGMNVWAMLPGHVAEIVLPNWSASYSIVLDTLRSPRSALVGFGTDSYGNTYTRLKPVWLNGQANWQTVFGSASDWPLTLLVTQGLISFLALVWLVIAIIKLLRQSPNQLQPLAAIVVVSFCLQLLLPLQVGVLLIQLLALACLLSSNPQLSTFLKIKPHPGQWWVGLAGCLLLVGVALTGWYYSKPLMAYYHLYTADRAAFQNDPRKLYDEQRLAVVANPYLDVVRRQYATTNLKLALAISSNKNATDDDRAQVTQLVSQSIREAKAATIIDPTNTQNWATLAEIYRNVSTVNKDAGQWNISALVNTIQTDPANPILRLSLGQALVNENLLDQAAQSFNQAIQLKPDLPSGYYQLGQILKANGQLGTTKVFWQKAQSLLPADSDDYRMLTTSLKDLDTLIAATQSAKKAPAATVTPTPAASPTSNPNASESALLRLNKNTPSTSLDSIVPPSGQDSANIVDHPSTTTP